MSLSSKEAAASLSEAEIAGRRSAQLYGYRKASPHLVMWGIIWVLGYGGTDLLHDYTNLIWTMLVAGGLLAGTYLNWRASKCTTEAERTPRAWRMLALGLIAVFFVFATYAIMWPVHGRQLAAYPALITGSVYAAVGLWAGMRYVLAGILVVALTLFGFYYVEHILLWMAFVGGGSMILAGLWFRTV